MLKQRLLVFKGPASAVSQKSILVGTCSKIADVGQSFRYKSTAAYETETEPFFAAQSGGSKGAPLYVAATRQHVGKTSTSLALLSGLQKRFDHVGFMKPVGQQSLQVEEDGKMVDVDKDAVLVKHHFGLDHLRYRDISPVLIPRGYTRDYLDGKIKWSDQEALVENAFREVSSVSEIVLCEGTGHCAVGSIVHASNAQVARWLGAKMILGERLHSVGIE